MEYDSQKRVYVLSTGRSLEPSSYGILVLPIDGDDLYGGWEIGLDVICMPIERTNEPELTP